MPFPSVINLSNLGTFGIRITGQSGTGAGEIVAAAGDVNHDGIQDFIVGGGGQKSAQGMSLGEFYVIYGKVGLSSFTLAPGILPADGFRVGGEDYDENFGTIFSFAGIGDINHDGFADVIFGAPAFDSNGAFNNNVGAAYVVFGSASGASLQVGSSMGAAGFKITGVETQGQIGQVSAAGDFNHDGIADFAVGSSFIDGTGTDSGAVQIFFGKATGWGNLNFGSTTTPSVTLVGDFAAISGHGNVGDNVGAHISSVGDVNGDGIDDIIVSATGGPTNPNYNYAPNYAYVVFGSATAGGTIHLRTMSASVGFRITGDAAHKVFGASVAGIGDFNGDGFADVAVSAQQYYGSPGRTYIIFGHATNPGVTVSDSMFASVGFEIIGSGIEDAGFSVSRAGDVNGDGLADIILGAPDRLGTTSAAYVIFGKATGIGTINLSSLSATDGFKIVGNSGSETGFTVAGVGDVNGDHVDDLAVSAPFEQDSYIIFGISSNTAPVIDLNGAAAGTSATLAYTENQAATALATAATVVDTDSANFDTGTLTVNFSANGAAEDRLSIVNQGSGAGQIGVSGSNVTYQGTTIGTFTGGGNGSTPLVITFNANATPTAVQALTRDIAYADVSDAPSTVARTVQFVVTDGDGGTSTAATATVNVSSVNDAPVNGGMTGSFSGNEDSGIALTGLSVSDPDSANSTVTLSVAHGTIHIATNVGGGLTAGRRFGQ